MRSAQKKLGTLEQQKMIYKTVIETSCIAYVCIITLTYMWRVGRDSTEQIDFHVDSKND